MNKTKHQVTLKQVILRERTTRQRHCGKGCLGSTWKIERLEWPYQRNQCNNDYKILNELGPQDTKETHPLQFSPLFLRGGAQGRRGICMHTWVCIYRVWQKQIFCCEYAKHKAYSFIIYYCIIFHTNNCKPIFVPPCICHIFFIHSSINGHLSCFHILTMNTSVHLSLLFY